MIENVINLYVFFCKPKLLKVEAEKKTGFVSKVFAWPIKGFEFVRHLFIED